MDLPPSAEEEVRGPSGFRLFLRRWDPPAGARAVAVICHGGFEHGGRYGGIVGELLDRSYRCYAGDLRGSGRSSGLKGHVEDFADYVADLGVFVDRARSENEGLPFVLIGHSMGGLVALMYVQERGSAGLQALVLSGPLLGLALKSPAWKEALGKALSRVLPRLRMAHGLRSEELSHDPAVVRGYADDPLVFDQCSTRWFTAMLAAMDRANAGPVPQVPTLWMHAGDDRINRIDETRAFAARAGAPGSELRVYPGFFHEILNEIGRERVYADVIDFLGRRVPA